LSALQNALRPARNPPKKITTVRETTAKRIRIKFRTTVDVEENKP
jgi:hypothetical protein